MKAKTYSHYYGKGLPYFAGPVYQRGYGIGSLFRGLFRFAMPFLKQGARTVGRQALQTGIQLAGDVLENKPFKDSIRTRVREAGSSLKSKAENKMTQLLTGSGRRQSRKRKAVKTLASSLSSIKFGPPKRRRKQNRAKDIFNL